MSIYLMEGRMRQQAQEAMKNREFVQIGVIMDYDPTNYLATVQLYPEEGDDTPALQTGWLPIASPWVGDGWGMFCPPSPGDIVEVHSQNGSLQNGYIALRSYTTSNPPVAVSAGEFFLIHSLGATIKFTNDGKVSVSSLVEIDVTAPVINVGGGTVNLGDIGGVLLPMLNSVAQSVYNSHHHNDPVSGVTGVPNQQMTGTSLSSNVKSN